MVRLPFICGGVAKGGELLSGRETFERMVSIFPSLCCLPV